jgi:hypothetical protein
MAATNLNGPRTNDKLPLAHPTRVTYLAIAAIVLAIAVFVIWALWFPPPPILFR